MKRKSYFEEKFGAKYDKEKMPKKVIDVLRSEIVSTLLKGYHISDAPKLKDDAERVEFWKVRANVFQLVIHCIMSYFVSEEMFLVEYKSLKEFVANLKKPEEQVKVKRKRK